MQSRLLYLFTRTPLHVGAGASVGAIDQPIVRERHTGFPIIPGSALKGVLADYNGASSNPDRPRNEKNRILFGSTDPKDATSGSLSFGEGKILLFPVRSAQGCFAWVTCPLALARLKSAGGLSAAVAIPLVDDNRFYGDAATLGSKAVIEDSLLTHEGLLDETLITALRAILEPLEPAWAPLIPGHLALVSNGLFSYFVATSCEVAQHIRLDDETGTVADGALFNQENVPSECLFFAPLTELRPNSLEQVKIPPVIQLGGDASTGLGFCTILLQA